MLQEKFKFSDIKPHALHLKEFHFWHTKWMHKESKQNKFTAQVVYISWTLGHKLSARFIFLKL